MSALATMELGRTFQGILYTWNRRNGSNPHVQLRPGGVADAISVALENIESEFLVLLGDMLLMESHFGLH